MRHAILIGCEKYTHFNDTRFAHADVDLVFQTLTEYCDFKPEDVLRYKLSEDSGLKPQEILDGIKSFSSQAGSANTILFYFAGHGHRTSNGTYLVLPSTTRSELETTAVNLDNLAGELRQESKVCVRIFDACHSGADVRDAHESGVDADEFLRSITNDTTGWVTLAGCAPTQKSHSDPSLGHGIFTYFLCKEIKAVAAGEHVHPELIKVPIVKNVYTHAEKMGLEQTPTLNASISGNVTIATRKEITESDDKEHANETLEDLRTRISKIKKIEPVTNDYLQKLLSSLATACKVKFEELELIDSTGEVAIPETIDDVASNIQIKLVKFSEGLSLNSRHTLKTVTKYKRRSLIDQVAAFTPREIESVNYVAEQSYDTPESVVQIEFPGDSSCLPTIVVILYVIPLQISTCNLVSVWNYGWNDSDTPSLIKNYYEQRRVGDPVECAESVVKFAAEKFGVRLKLLVEGRVTTLEREIL